MSVLDRAVSSPSEPGERRGSEGRARRPWQGMSVTSTLERTGVPLFLVAAILIFSFLPSTGVLFRSQANLQNIFANQSVTGLIALAMVVPLVAGSFDLAAPAIAGLSSVTVMAVSGTHHQPLFLGLLAALAVALIAGVCNGVLVAVMKMSPIIITLGTYTFIGGLLQLYTKGVTISNGLPESLANWASGKWLGVARPFWLLIAVALLVWYVLTQTPFGRQLGAIGSNDSAARLAGFRVERALFITFLISGTLAGVAGMLLTARSGSADATTGSTYLFPSLAAVFLGQTAIRPGHYNVWGTVLGLFFLAVAVNGFTLLGAQAWVTQVFNGGALVVSVAVSTLMARLRDQRARSLAIDRAHSIAGPTAKPGATTLEVPPRR